VLPLDAARRGPAAGTATALAIRQLRAALALRPATAPRPVLVLDSRYDVPELVQAQLGIDLLARLARNRRLYRPPGPYRGCGAPPKHGPLFRLGDPSTHGPPDWTQTATDAAYGQVTIDGWARLHAAATPAIEVTVVRVTVAQVPRQGGPPKPLWLAWHGGALPADRRLLWR
jgi:hypothetical protein